MKNQSVLGKRKDRRNASSLLAVAFVQSLFEVGVLEVSLRRKDQ